jgi:hypothetical protein
MTAADSPSAISVFRINSGQAADAANQAAPPLGKVTSFSRIGRGKKKAATAKLDGFKSG